MRLDANGNKLWDQTFGGDGSESLRVLRQTSDGGFILGGESSSGVSGSKTGTNFGGSDFWIIKLAPEAPRLGLLPQSQDSFRFVLFPNQTNRLYVIDYSADLLHWTPLETNQVTQAALEINDLTVSNSAHRFYRARRSP